MTVGIASSSKDIKSVPTFLTSIITEFRSSHEFRHGGRRMKEKVWATKKKAQGKGLCYHTKEDIIYCY